MTWTTPRTWVVGETLTAALLNTHVRDNELDIDTRLDALEAAGGVVLAGESTGETSTSNTASPGNLSTATVSIAATAAIKVVLPFRKSSGAAAAVDLLQIVLSPGGAVVSVAGPTDAANSAGSGLAIFEIGPYDASYGNSAGAKSYYRNAAGTNTFQNFIATTGRNSATITGVTAQGQVGSGSISVATKNMKVYKLP